MEELQRMYESAFEDRMKAIILAFIVEEFGEQSIVLNDRQLKYIEEAFISHDLKDSFEIQREDLFKFGEIPEFRPITIRVDDPKLRTSFEALLRTLADPLPLSQKLATILLKSVKQRAKATLRKVQQEKDEFSRHVREIWSKPLQLLDLVVGISLEICSDLWSEGTGDSSNEGGLFEVLCRLQARSCQIAQEVLLLLKNGFADGAHARWRTLHEMAVIGSFIGKYGEECAQRYMDHQVVEFEKLATQHSEYAEVLKHNPFDPEEISQIHQDYEGVLNEYGPQFRNDYGWASAFLKNAKPSFVDIERDVEMEFCRPTYKEASHNVHASAKGAFYRLGLPADDQGVLLAGPSDVGIPHALDATAGSLIQMTITLLQTAPTLDALTTMQILMQLSAEIRDSLAEVAASGSATDPGSLSKEGGGDETGRASP
ncbi:MAG: DUF5677 domain-containing protein [Candidatus Sumerlaeota bacterium]|nr:DUF5677 domain-containing protein [Candidatus Sumerlaeota bacterium]